MAQCTGTAERNMATALRFWVAAVVAWCAREGHGAHLKEMPGDFGRACPGLTRRNPGEDHGSALLRGRCGRGKMTGGPGSSVVEAGARASG